LKISDKQKKENLKFCKKKVQIICKFRRTFLVSQNLAKFGFFEQKLKNFAVLQKKFKVVVFRAETQKLKNFAVLQKKLKVWFFEQKLKNFAVLQKKLKVVFFRAETQKLCSSAEKAETCIFSSRNSKTLRFSRKSLKLRFLRVETQKLYGFGKKN
jgi:regulatory protein YycI of two-component signal transduction system YycFG